MQSLAQKYKPVLSTPFGREGYREIAPCGALKPYIRCFWTENRLQPGVLIIPDTCMDIIIRIGGGTFFCALDESSYYSTSIGSELFGVRFYAWTAALFSRRDLSGSSSGTFPVGEFFDDTEELNAAVQQAKTFEERAITAERWLMRQLDNIRADSDLLNAVDFIIDGCGAREISDLRMHTAVSARRLERLFAKNMGVSPKTFSSLVRYQLLWQEMTRSPGFNVLDAVEKYGYSDQSHLLKDFRRRHLMNPNRALDYANNSVDVVFLQSILKKR